ncbi:hypothetical protein [Weissella viridescens]|nr:hypothetical protein [Weissella viridescens]
MKVEVLAITLESTTLLSAGSVLANPTVISVNSAPVSTQSTTSQQDQNF